MYGKLFTQMYDGSLRTKGPWEALVTFQQLVILANKQGEVDMTAEAISFRTGIPLEFIQRGLAVLLAPDPGSRTPDEEGRRIIPLYDHVDWGWRVVNYARYSRMQSEEERRAYLQDYNAKRPDRPRKKKNTTATGRDTLDTKDARDRHIDVAVAVDVEQHSSSAVDRMLELVAATYGAAKAIGWAAELRMWKQGGRGAELTCTADQLEAACHELLLQTPTGQQISLQRLRAFVRSAVQPAAPRGRSDAGRATREERQTELEAKALGAAARFRRERKP